MARLCWALRRYYVVWRRVRVTKPGQIRPRQISMEHVVVSAGASVTNGYSEAVDVRTD